MRSSLSALPWWRWVAYLLLVALVIVLASAGQAWVFWLSWALFMVVFLGLWVVVYRMQFKRYRRAGRTRRECQMSPGYKAGSDDEMPISARNSSATVGASVGRYEMTTASPARTSPGVTTRR